MKGYKMNITEIEDKLFNEKKYYAKNIFNWLNYKQEYGFESLESCFIVGFTDYLTDFEYDDWCRLLDLDPEEFDNNDTIIEQVKEIVDVQYDEWFTNNYIDINLENYSE